jgi:hypothetical protein
LKVQGYVPSLIVVLADTSRKQTPTLQNTSIWQLLERASLRDVSPQPSSIWLWLERVVEENNKAVSGRVCATV